MTQLALLHPDTSALAAPPANVMRRSQTGDDAALAALLGTAFPTETWDAARARRDLLEAADVLDVFVADADDSRLRATASLRHDVTRFPGIGYLHWVAVDPRDRGAGLGTAAVEAVGAACRTRGITQLLLETDDERASALRVYLRLGFTPLYRAPDHVLRWSRALPAVLGGVA